LWHAGQPGVAAADTSLERVALRIRQARPTASGRAKARSEVTIAADLSEGWFLVERGGGARRTALRDCPRP